MDFGARRQWLAVLARASRAELEAGASCLGPLPAFDAVRAPEAGMVMLRGRVGGTGDAFNLGEASLTRCAVRLSGDVAGGMSSAVLGVGYVLGRDRRRAELIAVFDALLQDAAWVEAVQRELVTPLHMKQQARREAASRAAASSKVDFFTLVRGEA